MGLAQQFKPAPPKPKGFVEQLTEPQKKAAKAYRGPENHGDPAFAAKKGAKRGPKPIDDPKAVLTLRVEASVIERLPKDWRAQAAEFLRGLAS